MVESRRNQRCVYHFERDRYTQEFERVIDTLMLKLPRKCIHDKDNSLRFSFAQAVKVLPSEQKRVFKTYF